MRLFINGIFLLSAILISSNLLAEKSIVYLGSLVPAETQEYYKKLQKNLRAKGIDSIDNTLPNKMHITLKFVGIFDDQEKSQITNRIKESLSKVKFSKFKVRPNGFVVLGGQKPTMILAKVKSPELEALFKDIDAALAADNIAKKDARPFLAHLTIGTFGRNEKMSKAEVQAILDTIASDDVELEINDVQLLGLPADKGGVQYQDPTDYEVLLSFPAEK